MNIKIESVFIVWDIQGDRGLREAKYHSCGVNKVKHTTAATLAHIMSRHKSVSCYQLRSGAAADSRAYQALQTFSRDRVSLGSSLNDVSLYTAPSLS